MDTSKKFSLMLDSAINQYPDDFKDFDRTKNVQDQLQEMIEGDCHKTIYEFYEEWYIPYCDEEEFTSMEQLWLAFVMKEKHSKLWSNGEWTKE